MHGFVRSVHLYLVGLVCLVAWFGTDGYSKSLMIFLSGDSLMKKNTLAVCSWSLLVGCLPELERLMQQLGIDAVQLACGDPVHASWNEDGQGDMVQAALAAKLNMTGTMLGFPGESYQTIADIRRTGGFGDPALRPERLKRLEWGLQRTQALGLQDMTLHTGFIPALGDPDRKPFMDTMGQVGGLAEQYGINIAFETGQESAGHLCYTLDELKCRRFWVNFDPANMILYGAGDPIKAVEILAGKIRSVHFKDAVASNNPGVDWGAEVVVGKGQVNIPKFCQALKRIGFSGPMSIEREVGTQAERVADIATAKRVVEEAMAG